MYWCYHCYATNPRPTGPCINCGMPVEPPAETTRRERLEWTLRHPDGDRAIVAARALGQSRDATALPALQRIMTQAPDPYLAAAAARAIVTIAGVGEGAELLSAVARDSSPIVRRAIEAALAERG
jgi:HEAT repeat protein